MKKASTPTTEPIDELFWENAISIEHLIWIDSQCAHFCDALREFIDDEPHEFLSLLGLSANALEADGYDFDEPTSHATLDAIQTTIARKQISGFLVRAAMAVPHNFSDDGKTYSIGWGYQQLKWFYTQALDRAFVEKLIAWRESVAERERRLDRKEKKAKR